MSDFLQPEIADEFVKTTGFFESFDETPVYYEVRGQGEPIILLYGIACSANHWHYQIQRFSKHQQTITMDYRGHQKTPLPLDSKNLSIEAIAKDLICLVEHLELEKVNVWGHSFATQVILSAYEQKPEIFKRLVLVNAFASNPLKHTKGFKVTMTAFTLIKKSFSHFPSQLSFLWKNSVTHPFVLWLSAFLGGFNPSLSSYGDIEVYSRGVGAVDLETFMCLFEQMTSFDKKEVLEQINIPTLIIGGSKDTITPLRLQEEIHHRIPQSEFHIVPLGSHCTQLDMPEMVNLIIERFFKIKT